MAFFDSPSPAIPPMACNEPISRSSNSDNSLLAEDLQCAITQAWQALQETPPYVEQQMTQCRGFLESIAVQRER